MRVCIGIFGEHSVNINRIKLKNKVQRFLVKNCKLNFYIKK